MHMKKIYEKTGSQVNQECKTFTRLTAILNKKYRFVWQSSEYECQKLTETITTESQKYKDVDRNMKFHK